MRHTGKLSFIAIVVLLGAACNLDFPTFGNDGCGTDLATGIYSCPKPSTGSSSIAYIGIRPDTDVTIDVGESAQYTGVAEDSLGRPAYCTSCSFQWSTSNPRVASISGPTTGIVTVLGDSAGKVIVTSPWLAPHCKPGPP